MLKRIASVVGLLFIGAIVFVVAWMLTHAEGSAACTLASGRSISARSNHWSVSLVSSKDSATILTGGRTIVVAPSTLSVDGRVEAVIPKGTKAVDVRVQSGVVTFTAERRGS